MGPAAQGLPHACLLAPRPGRAWEALSSGLLPASCHGGMKGTHRGTAARSERRARPALPPMLQLAPGAEGGNPCSFHDGTQSSTAETPWPRVSRVTPSLPGGRPPPAVTVPPSSATRQRAAGQGRVEREHRGTPAPGPRGSGAGCPGAPLPTAWGRGCHPEGGSPSCGQAPGVPPKCQDPKLPEVPGRLLRRRGLRAWGWQPAGAGEAAEYFPWRAGGQLAHGHTWYFPSPAVS